MIKFGEKEQERIAKLTKEERERGFEAAWKSALENVEGINHAIEYGEFYPQNLIWRIEDMIFHLNQMEEYLLGVKPRK